MIIKKLLVHAKTIATCSFIFLIFSGFVLAAETKTRVRIFGLFLPDRENDLRKIIDEWADIKLESIDFNHGEGVFVFDADKIFPKANAGQIITNLDNKLRSASNGTFGIRPLSTVDKEKLVRIEIEVQGLDCRACSFAAYNIIANIDGVEQATSSFKDGLITALIDPGKTQKAVLEETLKKRNVTLKQDQIKK